MATVASRHISRSIEFTQHDTYKIAHTARCKLHIAANRPDRNLRFVLGHAFTLDNLLLRIVEIENSSAKDEFEAAEVKPGRSSEIQAQDDRRAGVGGGAGVKVGETGSFQRKPDQKERRISFGNSANFRPSDLQGVSGNGSPRRGKSPPPASHDAESDSEEEFDPDDFVEASKPETALKPGTNVPSCGEVVEDEPEYEYDDEEDDGLGLQRFASASAAPPRRRSPSPPTDLPELSGSDSDEDEVSEPPSPPSLPEDVTRKMMLEGEEDEAMKSLYNQIRRCTCEPQHKDSPVSKGMKTMIYEGRRVGIVTVEA